MTANTTEKERAQALAEKHGATSYRNRADTQNPAYGFTPIQLAALIAEVEQAARRAPAVPQEPTSKQVVLGAGALLGQPEHTADNRHPEWHSAVEKVRKVYLAMLAAAPQPPEAAQLDDTNVVDMAQAVDLKEASPVQLPEPFAYVEHHKAGDNLWFDSPGGKSSGLYTEHQVLAILAQHGIKTK